MRRPVLALGVVVVMTWNARTIPSRDVIVARGGEETLEVGLRVLLLVVGVVAAHRLWTGASSARRMMGAWIATVVSLLVAQEWGAGAFRPGWAGRLLALALLATVLTVVAARVPSRTIA